MNIVEFVDATQAQRVAALDSVLNNKEFKRKFNNYITENDIPKYEVDFKAVHRENFKTTYKDGRYRQHYTVIVTNNTTGITESFSYFQGEVETVNALPKRGPNFKEERLLSFFYCIANDYSMLEHEGIKDGFDLIKEFGGDDPLQARDTFNALQLNHTKIKRLFDSADWLQIEKIVEGY